MEPGDLPKTEERNADGSSSSNRLTSRGSTVPMTNGKREYRTAGQHPFGNHWNECDNDPAGVKSQVISALKGLQWSCIDVLRVGPRDCVAKDLTIVLSIGVEGDSFDWEKGNAVVLRCQEILDQHGFSDVCCELVEVAPRRLENYRKWIPKNRGRYYYKGLPSSPTFLARSPDPTWNPPINHMDSGYPPSLEPKFLMPIGSHPITEKWNNGDGSSSLRSQVVQNLKGVNWTSVDILRCGYERKKDAPAILFVSVEPRSTTPEEARKFADRCAVTLINHGITDVSCEVKESHVVPLSKLQPPSAVIDKDRLWKASYNLTDLLGTTIAASDQQDKQGTKGPYLQVKTVKDGVETSSVCALTCRHVLSSSTPGRDHSGSSKIWQGCEDVVQLGNYHKTEVEHLTEWLERKYNRHLDDSAHQKLLESYNARTTIESRTFGHLAYARQGSNGRATDWALIKLDADKHERPLDTIQNQVPVGPGVHEGGYSHKYQEQRWDASSSNFFFWPRPGDGICTLQGVTPIASIQEPGSTDPVRSGAIPLAKVGHGSGLTFGLANQAFSILRRPGSSGRRTGDEHGVGEDDDLTSMTMCVLSKEGFIQNYSTASFGIPGDSGACVWDLNGRVAGMVTAGSTWDSEDRWTDVTYVTPMEWILEDMRECGLEATLCE